MKDEIRINGSDGHNVVSRKVLDWIDYYNNERYQWSLAKLSPAEYYRYVTTGEYPIPVTGDIQASVPGGAAPEPPEFNAFGFRGRHRKRRSLSLAFPANLTSRSGRSPALPYPACQ